MAYRECPHNGGVLCQHQARCKVCGWNPAVAQLRQEKLREPKTVVEKRKKKSRPSGANTGSGNLRKA